MKIQTFNVVELYDGEISGLHSFPNTREGELEAMTLFEKMIWEADSALSSVNKDSFKDFVARCLKRKTYSSSDQKLVICLVNSLP